MTDPAFIDDADATDIAEPQVIDVNEDGVDDAIVITEGDTTAMAADTDLDGGVDTVLIDIDGDGQPDVAVAEDGAGGYVLAFDRDGDGEFEEQQELTREELEAQLPDLVALLDAEFDASGTSGGTDATPTSTTGAAGSEPQVLDVNEDGIAETLVISGPDGATAAAADTDLDGGVDTVLIDLDGDGLPDVAVAEDGAGGYVVAFDRDGDGEFEEQQEMTRADLEAQLPELVELLDVEFDGAEAGATTTSTTAAPGGADGGQVLDVNEDGVAETLVISGPDGTTAAVVDTDADSDADTVLFDLDGDGQPDLAVAEDGAGGYVLAFDRDGDGEFEEEQAVSRAQLESELPEVVALLDVRFDGQSGSTTGDTPVSDTTGTLDSQLVDVDEDGQDDAVVITDGSSTVVAADTEGDREVDTVFLDLDNDGEFEAAVTEDGKGGFIVGFDNDGDGEFEEQQALTREELVAEMPQIAELLDITLDEASGETGGGTSPERAELVPEA